MEAERWLIIFKHLLRTVLKIYNNSCHHGTPLEMYWTEAPLSIGDMMSPGPGHLILAAPGLGWAGLGWAHVGGAGVSTLQLGHTTHLHSITPYFIQYYSIKQIIIIKY